MMLGGTISDLNDASTINDYKHMHEVQKSRLQRCKEFLRLY